MTVIDLEKVRRETAPAPRATQLRRPLVLRRAGRRPVRILTRLLLVVAAAAVVVWTGILPQQLGGSMSYVITDGVSMLPHFHAGDLVVLRRESSYHVGEVAAFHNQQLHVVVMHRIVAINHGRYTFKGDNNPGPTLYKPTKSQIVGAEWLHLPHAGTILVDLRTPVVAAVLLGALWLFSFSPGRRSRRRRRRHRYGS